jgi:hypothetical protein
MCWRGLPPILLSSLAFYLFALITDKCAMNRYHERAMVLNERNLIKLWDIAFNVSMADTSVCNVLINPC